MCSTSDKSSISPADDESSKTLLSHSEDQDFDRWRTSQHLTRSKILGILYLISTCVALTVGVVFGNRLFHANSFCASYTSHYSQVLDEVGITYRNVRFNGSFMKETAFRGPAGPQTDAAWESLGVNYKSVRISADQAIKSGLEKDYVKINPKYGGGYPANVEGLHQLHCLNLLRQALYWNYDYYHTLGEGAFKNDDRILQLHVTHCLDILRQQLQCSIDTGVLGQIWTHPDPSSSSLPQAFVDFNTEHRCKDFESVRAWAKRNQLPTGEDLPVDFLQSPDAKGGEQIWDEIP